MPHHHKIFEKFEPFKGKVEAGFQTNFLGVMVREAFFSGAVEPTSTREVTTKHPRFDEEYFEWIDLLESVTAAERRFTMIELGAGYGRWLANAAAAVRSYNTIPFFLLGVEAEPTHFKWMKQHLSDNGIKPSQSELIEAAVLDKDGRAWFHTGEPNKWYGQAVIEAADTRKRRLGLFRRMEDVVFNFAGLTVTSKPKKVKTVTLPRLLKHLDFVDLVDIDIQGAELMVLERAMAMLDQKVKKIHIGTHGNDIEKGLRVLFESAGWKNINDYPCARINETPFGEIKFEDGVQTWVNL